MANTRIIELSAPANTQFTGSESGWVMHPTVGNRLYLAEVNLIMGEEAKRFEVRKVFPSGRFLRLYRSVNRVSGAPDETTDSDFYAGIQDIGSFLDKGEYITIRTESSSSEMFAKIYYLDGSLAEISRYIAG